MLSVEDHSRWSAVPVGRVKAALTPRNLMPQTPVPDDALPPRGPSCSPTGAPQPEAVQAGVGPVVAEPVPAFATIFRTYSSFVFRVLIRLGVAEADADDVAQEVFLGVHRNLDRFEGRCALRTWIYGICHRRAVDYRRRARVRPTMSDEGEVDIPSAAGQEDALALAEARVGLERLLEALDDDKRSVFVLFEIEGIPMEEVAEIVACPLQTAYSRLYAARRKVESALKRQRAHRGESP